MDLRGLPADEARTAAIEADRLGLWAVLVDGDGGHESVVAGELAAATNDIHLAVVFGDDHPLTIAEDAAVLDHLSERRMLVVLSEQVDHVRALLAGAIVDGVALAPPPAQTKVPVWDLAELPLARLSGDLAADQLTIDERRDTGVTHLFVTWPDAVAVLARHLMTRAATPDFPQLVADMADRLPED